MLLSICIPSYNRKENLFRIVKEISKAKSEDFEIFVLDNHSDEDYVQELRNIDIRVRAIRKECNTGGAHNVMECIHLAKGRYALLCLDKDIIHGEAMDDFISVIQRIQPAGGYCSLEPSIPRKGWEIERSIVEKRGKFNRVGYIEHHPSGYFFKTAICNEVFSTFNMDREPLEFYADILLAKCAALGDTLIYKSGLISEGGTLEECMNQQSFSYSMEQNNLFFLPHRRRLQFDLKVRHLESLQLSTLIKHRVLRNICWQYIRNCTFGLRDILRVKEVCYHYRIPPREIVDEELKKNYKDAVDFLISNQNMKEGFAGSSYIILLTRVRYLVNVIKAHIKRTNG